jgi:hypothetical protein
MIKIGFVVEPGGVTRIVMRVEKEKTRSAGYGEAGLIMIRAG